MEKFTTTQLQQALIALRNKKDADSVAAWNMTFDEVANRMGDESFADWCDAQGW